MIRRGRLLLSTVSRIHGIQDAAVEKIHGLGEWCSIRITIYCKPIAGRGPPPWLFLRLERHVKKSEGSLCELVTAAAAATPPRLRADMHVYLQEG